MEFLHSSPPDTELVNNSKPSLELIKELQNREMIKPGSSFWWSTDYAPDPRELLSFEEFSSRLHPVGENHFIYTNPRVPMTLLSVPVLGTELPLIITARPYGAESTSRTDPAGAGPMSLFDYFDSPDELKDALDEGTYTLFPRNCFPHVRGLFTGARGNHVFWSPLSTNTYESEPFYNEVQRRLDGMGLGYIRLSTQDRDYKIERSYFAAHQEAVEKGLSDGKGVKIDFPFDEVTVDEFLETAEGTGLGGDVLVNYPLRLPEFTETLPLVIATRTHMKANESGIFVLGLQSGETHERGAREVKRIRNEELASYISKEISDDFSYPAKTVVFYGGRGRTFYHTV